MEKFSPLPMEPPGLGTAGRQEDSSTCMIIDFERIEDEEDSIKVKKKKNKTKSKASRYKS